MSTPARHGLVQYHGFMRARVRRERLTAFRTAELEAAREYRAFMRALVDPALTQRVPANVRLRARVLLKSYPPPDIEPLGAKAELA